jgi:hypothetical protein
VIDNKVGLCTNCRYARVVKNERGSAFFLCERSKTDARFVKYPALPVIACEGYGRDSIQSTE